MLQAPITAEIEDDLKNLVARFAETKVLEALDPLVTKSKWNDWQCVANAIHRYSWSEIGGDPLGPLQQSRVEWRHIGAYL